MTSDGEALFRAICERPWEDTPRLAYADWLEEHGQPERAEFIRLQMALAAIPPNERWGTPQYDRASKLAEEWDAPEMVVRWAVGKGERKPWSADLPTGNGMELSADYERGFRHRVIFSSMKWVLAHADAVAAAAPVDEMTVKRLKALEVAPLLAMPWVERLKVLRLSGSFGALGAEAIATSENLPRLEYLDLSRSNMNDAGLKALAAASGLPNLRRLGLEGNPGGVTEAGLNELLKSKTLKALKAVDGVRWTLLPMANPQHIYAEFYKRFPESD